MNAKRKTLNETKQEEQVESINLLFDMLHGHISASNRWPNLYFSESGKARFGSVVGWIIGMYQGGAEKFALEAAHDFVTRLGRLAGLNDMEVELPNGETVLVPNRKVVMHDDGTFNGFAITFYYPVCYKKYEEALDKYYKEMREETIPQQRDSIEDAQYRLSVAKMKTKKHFGIPENTKVCGIDLTLTKYYRDKEFDCGFLDLGRVEIYYRYAYHGGFLYHGNYRITPLFSVDVSYMDKPFNGWSVHT